MPREIASHEFYLSVIMPTYNRVETLEKTLLSLEEQTLSKDLFEVVVVDDGSTDGTKEFLERYANRGRLHLTFACKENEGQGVARNLGYQISDGHVLIFLQDDTITTPTLLEEHKKVHDTFATHNFICLGNTSWDPALDINAYMLFLERSGMQFDYGALEKAKLIDPVLQLREATFRHFYTSNISMKRTLFEKQQFNPKFKKYGWEDIELGHRMVTQERAVILYNTRAKALHHHQLHESELPTRMMQIGKNAVKAQKISSTLKVVPSLWKRVIFMIIGSAPVVNLVGMIAGDQKNKKNLTFFGYLHYYVLIKRYFLKGIAQAKK